MINLVIADPLEIEIFNIFEITLFPHPCLFRRLMFGENIRTYVIVSLYTGMASPFIFMVYKF